MFSQLTLADRSFQYGDGVFTTMKVQQGQIQLWPLHLQRLQHSLQRLSIIAPDWNLLTKQLNQAISADAQVLKLIISRGQGGRGYNPISVLQPGIYISTAALPDYQPWQQQGISLGIAEFRLAVQPALAGLKHTSRLEQVLLKQEVQLSGFDDLLAQDMAGYVTEVSAANIFFYRQGSWFTPELTRAGVAGIMRQHLLNVAPDIQLVNWTLSELEDIDAMAITNALMGVVPVASFAHRELDITAAVKLRDLL